MADQIVRPHYTAEQEAWIASYVAAHGPIKVMFDGHPSTIASNGWITVSDRPVEVVGSMLVEASVTEQAAIKVSALGIVDGWIAGGMT